MRCAASIRSARSSSTGQGGGELRGDPRRGHHVHILHRIYRGTQGQNARNVGRLRAILNDIGDSLVVVEDDDIVKVHVHTDQPNKALEEGLKFGPLLMVKIENMREQHTAKVIEGTADTPKERVIVPAEKKDTALLPSQQARVSRACSPISAQMPSFRAVRP